MGPLNSAGKRPQKLNFIRFHVSRRLLPVALGTCIEPSCLRGYELKSRGAKLSVCNDVGIRWWILGATKIKSWRPGASPAPPLAGQPGWISCSFHGFDGGAVELRSDQQPLEFKLSTHAEARDIAGQSTDGYFWASSRQARIYKKPMLKWKRGREKGLYSSVETVEQVTRP
jgi:hypothetical protein